MKILFVVPYTPSRIRVRPYHLIRELGRHHDLSVLALETDGGRGDPDTLGPFCCRIELVPVSLRESVWRCVAGVVAGVPLQGSVCRSAELERRLHRLLSEESFDIVHVEHLRAAHVRPFLPVGMPTVFDSVDCISLLLERTLRLSHSPSQRLLAALELRRTRGYEARLLGEYDRVAVTTEEDCAALQSLREDARVSVVPNGVDTEYFAESPQEREPATLVLSGKMSYHANATAALHLVRDILPSLRQAHPEIKVRIVGSGPPPSVKALARDSAISVTGYIPDLREPLGTATVAVCPVTVRVGVQNKILEAMAMGVPVVASREGAAGLRAEPGRDLLVADTAGEFAGAVGRLLDDPVLRRAVGAAGRTYVTAHHRWENAAGDLEALYGELVGRPKGPGASG